MFFSIFTSGSQFVYQSRTNLAISAEGHLSNIPIKLERNRPRGIDQLAFKDCFLFLALAVILFVGADRF